MLETVIFYPTSLTAWRKWLQKNHLSKQAVWLVFYTKKSQKKSITWSEAVDVALCYGWIDSKKIKIDEETTRQFFSKRKPQSTWSKINKEKINLLIEQNLMTEEGLKSIETAKKNGSWTILDEVEELIIPQDLEKAFKKHKSSKEYFLSCSKTAKKMMLQWIVLAKQPKTRQKRIDEIAELTGQKKKPKQF
ncbi:YdeI/OmpD-associated family protein [Epilithonimonas sp.]|uniref:YdeI/OmpD-associated family protein n=1 Tax=Epilithonimonas sp. TaxID=2894511 RepID=UPI002FDE2CF6